MKRLKHVVMTSVLVMIIVVANAGIFAMADSVSAGGRERMVFSDVAENAWYAESVYITYENGLMQGRNLNFFDGNGTLTRAEAVTLAVRLCGEDEGEAAENTSLWYEKYIRAAVEKGLIQASEDSTGVLNDVYYNEVISRGEMAEILASAVKVSKYDADLKNSVEDLAVADVSNKKSYYESVYYLYRLGILNGSDSNGNFHPGASLTRAEMAAMLARVAKPEMRISLAMTYDRSVPRPGTATLRNLLVTGLAPVGHTMYVWGGAWNEEDTGAGIEAVTIGMSSRWQEFCDLQTASYDYTKTRYQIHDGLDCSGFVGWTTYNTINTESGGEGLVIKSTKLAKTFAEEKGWGRYIARDEIVDYRPGDIMSTSGHVYIAIGRCEDGSIVLMHASPDGVQISGTVTPSDSSDSKAIRLATEYMKKYYPEWMAKYPDVSRPLKYVTSYDQMRWDVSGNSIMTDPDGYSSMTPEEVLADLFNE